jgi:polyisoprenyl-teichoic acid--peptidoglycan teichoic acid transferase
MTVPQAPATQPLRRDPHPTPKPKRWPLVAGGALAVVAAVVIGFLLFRPGASVQPSASASPSPTATLNADLLSNRLTVLLLGLDSNEVRRERGKGVNSDTIMLASVSADQSEITLISIPRDTVDVPLADGSTWSQKINAIYSVDGAQGMVDAASSLLEVEIDGYVTIDMGDLIQLVDAVGGVRVNPKAPLVDAHLKLDMKAGPQRVEGETALDYVRTRFDTDFARAARQQEVILKLVSKLIDPDADIDMQTLLDGLDSFDTNLPLDQLPTLLEIAKRAQSAKVTDQVLDPDDGFITAAGDFGDGRGYVLKPDIDAMRAFAAKHLAE